jgi:excisionase family DNA binding protein
MLIRVTGQDRPRPTAVPNRRADPTDGSTRGEARLLTPHELAEYLDVPLATVYSWRYQGAGPPGFRVGRYVRYRWKDVQKWILDQLEAGTPQQLR